MYTIEEEFTSAYCEELSYYLICLSNALELSMCEWRFTETVSSTATTTGIMYTSNSFQIFLISIARFSYFSAFVYSVLIMMAVSGTAMSIMYVFRLFLSISSISDRL
ncbi:unnamed protein product [Acanthoscelides obtectus]|uniref:Uncharacterized protein n=1 Tax=Acanthoscelides obtectus TaxID=200917 RepID=A0A9P0MG81_ACAOB|nr:unnamed protein product [Acanthoscelides obtectus]CAK1639543.1 hypothetical protein AOBTE_LOCUS11235 [Acanthoscelides obtectus]